MTMTLHEPITSGSNWRIPTPTRTETLRVGQSRGSTQQERALAAVRQLAGGARSAARSGLSGLTTLALVGSVVVAPALALCGLLALFLPLPLAVRDLAPVAIFGALLWVTLAIFGAHLQVALAPEEPDPLNPAEPR